MKKGTFNGWMGRALLQDADQSICGLTTKAKWLLAKETQLL